MVLIMLHSHIAITWKMIGLKFPKLINKKNALGRFKITLHSLKLNFLYIGSHILLGLSLYIYISLSIYILLINTLLVTFHPLL
jgi:hypothetical protein